MNAIAQRQLPALLDDAHAASQRLATATRSWPTFMPTTPALDEALATAEGLKRTLCELRPFAATLKSAPRAHP